MERIRNHKGITLIALVITIIVLLILAGVAINLALDSNGIFSRANEAVEKYNNGVAKEEQTLTDILDEMESTATKTNIPNRPKLVAGMTPVKYTLPTDDKPGELVKTNAGDSDWYNYDEKRWANAQTEDGSLWVWIPRYAYKINPSTQTTDVVFLRGNGDNYYDESGNVQTAKRCKSTTDEIDTKTGFTVHPAFTDESKIDYRNGGWNSELTGIWVAKFEAGYATSNKVNEKAVASEVTYGPTSVPAVAVETGNTDGPLPARNWLDGEYGETPTAIKYPVFQPLAYSMNYINHSDAFSISRSLTGANNIYGFTASTADTHLMKDSEWGMVAYLSKSKYGLKTTNIYINNINLNSGGSATTKEAGNELASAYAVTGCSTDDPDGVGVLMTKDTVEKIIIEGTSKDTLKNGATDNTAIEGIYVWNQKNGQRGSSTGNMYGIYDLSGGVWERTAGYVSNGSGNIDNGKSFASKTGGTSSQYVKVYAHDASKDNTGATDADAASEANYDLEENQLVYGDAIHETSSTGAGTSSWYGDNTYFPCLDAPFLIRGGYLWMPVGSGLFCFSRIGGDPHCARGFRPVVVAL